MKMSLAEAGRICQAQGLLDQPDITFTGVAIDSRKVKTGCLFVCLAGERTDGHNFAEAALKNGAVAILAERPLPGLTAPCLVVPDTVKALGQLAGHCRRNSKAKVVCLTGTAGKTTLKEALKAILGKAGSIAATERNFNNQIGLPLTILNASGNEDFWILEAGISHDGDMDELGAIARPDLAIILNVGPGHCEGLGKKGVAWHKARLLKYLAPAGHALVSADYPDLVSAARDYPCPLSFFSTGDSATVDFRILSSDVDKGMYSVALPEGRLDVSAPFQGEYGKELVCAACACAFLMDVPLSLIRAGCAEISLPEQRFRLEHVGGWTVIDDTYNANPLSMRRMLQAAEAIARKNGLPLVAVLGEMGELGGDAPKYHYELGAFAASLHPQAVFWKGNFFDEFSRGFGADSMNVYVVDEAASFSKAWDYTRLPSSGVVIFKGSRANHLEEFLEALKGQFAGAGIHVL